MHACSEQVEGARRQRQRVAPVFQQDDSFFGGAQGDGVVVCERWIGGSVGQGGQREAGRFHHRAVQVAKSPDRDAVARSSLGEHAEYCDPQVGHAPHSQNVS